MRRHDTGSLLGRGIYDVGEIARLVRRSEDEVSGWARSARGRGGLLLPRSGRLFSFYDLVTAVVIAELRRRDAPLRRIAIARDYLARELDVQWPLAHAAGLDRLASVGRNVYYGEPGDWVDASEGGQIAIQEVVEPLVQRLGFDAVGMASEWRPASGVVVNPRIQAGAPCVEGTRVSTQFLAELVDAGEDPIDIAADYALPIGVVQQALQYETGLAA